ncbi:MAG: type II toxin-antitoxin system VapC family toxin [Flammeovirgaceae bacterium]|nr:MAG: type II toxin-antitoxin system VapC family toxin [Flammeovirgaceae bacterium]
MSGIRIVSDTNPLIYLLSGSKEVGNHLDGKECWISVITELELFGKKGLSAQHKREIQKLLDSCFIVDLLPEIKSLIKDIQQTNTLKLPDAIIAATAIYLDLPLLTADKNFKKIGDLELILISI